MMTRFGPTSTQRTRTFRDHLKKLSSINKEVEELHPILDRLLRKLPTIAKVEYRQGPSEMGADFVMQRTDPAIGQTHYIGVIAKVGAIKQDHAEVNRQIEECEIERYFDGGPKKVTISEVWIVTTGTITENAKAKINKKFSARAIRFIAGEDLAELLDKHIPDIWDNLPPGISAYFASLRESLQIADMQFNISAQQEARFYIELDLHEVDPDTYSDSKQRQRKRRKLKHVDIASVIESRPDLVVIEGDMGSGKSKLVRELAYRYVDPVVYEDTRIIPFVTTAKEVVDDYDADVAAFVDQKLQAVMRLDESPDTHGLLFVDGIDEVLDPGDGDSVLSKLLSTSKVSSNATIVLTTRPNSGNSRELTKAKIENHYCIAPLSFKKITAFIEHVCTQVNFTKRLIEDIQKSRLFRQLPQSPIAAILLSRLITEKSSDLPSSMTELYSQSMELMLGRWDIEKGLETQREYEASTAICSLIATYVMDNGLDEMSASEALGIAENYLRRRHLDIEPRALFETIVSRSGVLVPEPNKHTVRFRHRSFAEYLYAKFQFEHEGIPVDKNYFLPYWTNSRFFYVGLKKDCPELLEEIIRWPANSVGERWSKVFSVPQYILAAITTPYDVAEGNLAGLLLEAAQLYLDLIKDPAKYNLGKMTEIEFLYVFQYVVRKSYGYEYFARALDQATIEIADCIAENDVKMYALFFAAVVGLDLESTGPVDFLLKNYKTIEIPLAISVGIRCENDAFKANQRSPLMKRHQKLSRKILRQNRALADEARRIFDVPLVPGNLRS